MSLRDSHLPHDEHRCENQLAGVRALIGKPTGRILDLGCGDGRLLLPLAADGHELVGIDSDQEAIDQCQRQLDHNSAAKATCLHADFLHDDWTAHEVISQRTHAATGFDLVLLLGNTLLTVVDLDEAIALMRRIRSVLHDDGRLLIDDLPFDLWPELTEGNWSSGISEDGSMQMIWHPAEPVFTIREGERVDPDSWSFQPDDRLLRLWTLDALRLVSRLAGLSEPAHHAEHGLLSFQQ